MAARYHKGVRNSILLKSGSSSSLVRGLTHLQPPIHNTVIVAVHKDRRNPSVAQEYLYPVASKTPAPLTAAGSDLWEGIRHIHHDRHHNHHTENDSDNGNQDAPAQDHPAQKPAGPSPSDSHPITEARPCTCPDCHWFPFHRPDGVTRPEFLTAKQRLRVERDFEDLFLYAPYIVSLGPCQHMAPEYYEARLLVEARRRKLDEQQEKEQEERKKEHSSAESSPPSPPSTGTGPTGTGTGTATTTPSTGALEGGARGQEEKGEEEAGGGDRMPRSGYDTTRMRPARNPRPAAAGGSGGNGSDDDKHKKDKKSNNGNGNGNGKGNGKGNGGGGGDHPAGVQTETETEGPPTSTKGDGKGGGRGMEEGGAPEEGKDKKEDKTIDDARIPYPSQDRGWTFWL